MHSILQVPVDSSLLLNAASLKANTRESRWGPGTLWSTLQLFIDFVLLSSVGCHHPHSRQRRSHAQGHMVSHGKSWDLNYLYHEVAVIYWFHKSLLSILWAYPEQGGLFHHRPSLWYRHLRRQITINSVPVWILGTPGKDGPCFETHASFPDQMMFSCFFLRQLPYSTKGKNGRKGYMWALNDGPQCKRSFFMNLDAVSCAVGRGPGLWLCEVHWKQKDPQRPSP